MTGSRVAVLARVAVTVAVLGWVSRGIDLSAARTALAGFGWSAITAALALVAADRALMLQRWLLLIRPMVSVSRADLTRIFLISSFLGSFLPAGIGGDAARALSVGRATGRSSAAVASVIVDRWLGLLAVGLSGCVGVFWSLAALPVGARALILTATVVLALGGMAGLFADRLVQWTLPDAWRRSWPGRLAMRLGEAMATYRAHGGALTRVAVLSLTVQVVRIALAYVLGVGLGIGLPFSYYWVFMPLNILVILLPVSLGGFGLPQGTMVWTLAPLGVEATPAFLLSTLFVALGIVGNVPGAWLFATGAGERVRERPRRSPPQ